MVPLANDRAKAVRFGFAFVSCRVEFVMERREREGEEKLGKSLINLTVVNE